VENGTPRFVHEKLSPSSVVASPYIFTVCHRMSQSEIILWSGCITFLQLLWPNFRSTGSQLFTIIWKPLNQPIAVNALAWNDRDDEFVTQLRRYFIDFFAELIDTAFGIEGPCLRCVSLHMPRRIFLFILNLKWSACTALQEYFDLWLQQRQWVQTN
jgi:hypothetical protein